MAEDGKGGPPQDDRGILPEKGRGGRLPLGRVLLLGLFGVVAVAMVYVPGGSEKTEEAAKPVKDQRVRQVVEAEDRMPPADEAPPPKAEDQRHEDVPAPQGQVGGEDVAAKLLEASRRAPVMAFSTTGAMPAPPASPPAADPPGVSDRPRPKESWERGLGPMLETTSIGRVKAAPLGDLNLLLAAGTVVPCTLDSAIDTTNPGFVSCHTDQDVLSANGRVVLLDRGTQVLGEYQQGLRQGQERIFVVWNRARTPGGIAVDLGSPAADALGRSGFDGEVETYFWTRFGATMLLSVISDAMSFGRAQMRGGDGGSYNTGTATVSGIDTAAADALRNTVNIPPVLKKNQGETVSIFVAKDVDFSGVYRLRASQAGGRR